MAGKALGRPGRLALAYLACERQRPVARDELADVLWGEELPASWEQMLRGVVFRLRALLSAAGIDGSTALVSTGGVYQLRLPADATVDIEEAAIALQEARAALETSRNAAAEAFATAALQVARRQFAPGAVGAWVERRQRDLRELHLGALEALGQAALAQARWEDAVAAAEEAVGVEAYRESAYMLLMAGHAGAGNRGEALQAYERCRAVLAEELGVDPSPPSEAAYLRLLGADPAASERAPKVAVPLTLPSALACAPGAFVVGREAEAGVLSAAYERSTVEGRQAVVLAGEPGVGKTTLLAQAARAAHARGARVLYGRCDEGLGVPYQPFAQALSQYVLTAPLAELTDHVAAHGGELARLVPAISRCLPGTPAPLTTDAEADRWRLFEAVVGLLGTAATAAPVVLVLDDLHWAAQPTLLLLRHVLASSTFERVLVLVAYRDSEVGPLDPLTRTLADLRRFPAVERLRLKGLDERGVAAFVAVTRESGDEDVMPFARAIHAHTAGNPFFVGELIRHLDETGAGLHGLPLDEAVLARDRPGGGLRFDVPPGVAEVVNRRLGRLSGVTNRTLTLASVVGVDFSLDVVEQAAGSADAEDTLDALDDAVAAHLVVETDTVGSYRFAHGLVRDALYRSLGTTRRARLHRRVGEVLDARQADEPARLLAVAHHFAEAVPVVGPTPAFGAALRAAEVAQRGLAFEQAEEQLRRALDFTRQLRDDKQRAHLELDVQHRLAALWSMTEGYHSASVAAAWNRARELARQLGDTGEVLASLWGLARLSRARGDLRLSQQLGAELLEVAKASPRGPLPAAFAVAGHESCGIAALFLGDTPASVRHLEEVVRLGDVQGIDGGTGALVMHPVVLCRSYLANARWLLGDETEMEELTDRALQLARATGHPINEAVVLLVCGMLAVMRGDHARVLAASTQIAAVAETGGIGPLAVMGIAFGAWAEAHNGDAKDGAAAARRAIEELRASGWELGLSFMLGMLADALLRAHDLDMAEATIADALTVAERNSERYYRAELCRLRANVELQRSPPRVDEAERWLLEALAWAERTQARPFIQRATAALAELHGARPRR